MYNEDTMDELYEKYRQAYLGNPLKHFVSGVAEQTGGLVDYAGQYFNSDTLRGLGDTVKYYSEELGSQNSTPYEDAANFVGRTAVPMALSSMLSSAVKPAASLVVPAGILSRVAAVNPVTSKGLSQVLTPFLEGASETGTIINKLREQGYSKEEIDYLLKDMMGDELLNLTNAEQPKIIASLAVDKLPKNTVKAVKKVLDFASPLMAEDEQNKIYKKYVNRGGGNE